MGSPSRTWTSGSLYPGLMALIGPAAVTLLAVPEEHPPTAVVAVLYVLAVVVAARLGGAGAGIGASLVSFIALNFFFTKPLHTFKVGAPEDLVSLFVFLATSVVVGLLLSSALDAKAGAERRELEARLMNRMEARLLAGEETAVVLQELARGLAGIIDVDAVEIATPLGSAQTRPIQDQLPSPSETFKLGTTTHDLGSIRLWKVGAGLDKEDLSVIRNVSSQLTVALEGVRLQGEIRRIEMEAQASQLKAALFSGVTHDVKTPLAAITASVTSLIEGKGFDEATRHEHLETIRQEADRLHRVVNNLLDVARLRAGALVVSRTPSPIDEVMESVLNRMRALLDGRPIEIRVADDVPVIPMDVVQIDQVLTNLVENAIKFTPPNTLISLLAIGTGDRVRVTVMDRGPGIPKEDRSRLFEPFERGDSGAGTGLGLAICEAIITAHGGRMWISENPQGGAAFTFELPCSMDDEHPGEVSDVRTRSGSR